MKPFTFETLIVDQKERIERKKLNFGNNLILDYIVNINEAINFKINENE
tara:strand:+ start:1895 stop:2041 length:147 start_codon:yes stop_codon:yes gene_type:complete